MTRDAFISFCKDNGITFEFGESKGWPKGSDVIYVTAKKEEIINFNGEKANYTPYLRFSHFDERPGMIYVRDNGLCDYQPDEWCKAECIKYRDSFKEE